MKKKPEGREQFGGTQDRSTTSSWEKQKRKIGCIVRWAKKQKITAVMGKKGIAKGNYWGGWLLGRDGGINLM